MSIKPPVVITESIIGVLDDSDNDDSSVKSTGGFVHVGVIISCSMWWVWSYGETRSRDAGIMPSYGPIIIPHMGLLLSPHNTHIRPFVVCFHPFNALPWRTLTSSRRLHEFVNKSSASMCSLNPDERMIKNQEIRCGGGTEVLIVSRVGQDGAW